MQVDTAEIHVQAAVRFSVSSGRWLGWLALSPTQARPHKVDRTMIFRGRLPKASLEFS